MKKILVFISILALVGCSGDDDNNASEINIRLSNISQFDFQNIVVNTTTGNTNFENISYQQTTNYKIFETAYRYAFVELQIDGETYRYQPIDYVGETPLENGNYTYQIGVEDSGLSLILIED
jgi:Tfp pilus assembly protein PilP